MSRTHESICSTLLEEQSYEFDTTCVCWYCSSNVHFDIIEDWNVPSDNTPRGLTYTGEPRHSADIVRSQSSASALDGDNEDFSPVSCVTMTVTQISATSITVSWSGIPKDEDWNALMSKASAPSGSARIAASMGGIMATIKGSSTAPAGHTSYSLYVTPVSGAARSHCQEERNNSLLVCPFVGCSGMQKIDFLSPGTVALDRNGYVH